MADDGDFFLEPKRRLTRPGWLILGLVGLLLLAAGGLALGRGARRSLQKPEAGAQPAMTLVPTFTPRPAATTTTPVVTLAARPWSDDSGPVGLLEVTLSLPGAARVSHKPPSGYRYWRGDLLQTRANLAWNGIGASEVRWYLLREPDAAFPATLAVTIDDQTLTVTLKRGTPLTATLVLE